MPKKKEVEYKKRKDNRYLIGRTKDDLEAFMKQQSDLGNHVSVVEMDTMYNDVSKGPFLQTFKFVDPMFAFAVFHEEKTAAAMTDGVNLLDRILGPELFDRLCTVIKPDRGSEFSDPEGIERRADGSLRTHVFYCDAMASWQKPHVENKHVEYRYILPNGADLRALGLTSQKALNLVLSHLNSRTLESIPSGKTPFMYARFFYPELVERMAAFGIEEVDSDYVLLKPQLLKDSCRIKANEKIFALIQNHSK
jgi:IS30 family transposase